MRVFKFLAAIALPMLLTLAIGLPRDGASVWAQLPPPNPLVATRALPSPPAQLQPPVPPQGVPSLAVLPSPPAPTPAVAAPRVFDCSCFGPGLGTHWMGRVAAPGYFGARQAATGACIAYNEREPQSPLIASRQSGLTSLPSLLAPGAEPPDLAASPTQSLPGTLNLTTPQLARLCSQCTCD